MGEVKMVIVVRKDIKCSRSDLISQTAKSAIMFLLGNNDTDNATKLEVTLSEPEITWLSEMKIDVLGVNSEDKLRDIMFKAQLNGIECNKIVNNDGILMCAAFGPEQCEALDDVIGSLKTYK